MPCDQVNTMSVDLRMADRSLLEQALKKLGLNYRIEGNQIRVITSKGVIQLMETQAILPANLQETLNQIKVAYSQVVVAEAANLYNWNLLEDEEEQGQYILRKYD